MPKLFDIAAFGASVVHTHPDDVEPAKCRHVGENVRSLLRRAVILNVDDSMDAFHHWIAAMVKVDRVGEYLEQFNCRSPWDHVFINLGTSDEGEDIGLFSHTVKELRHNSQMISHVKRRRDGRVVFSHGHMLRFMPNGSYAGWEMGSNADGSAIIEVWAAVFFFQLIHCRNVTTTESVYRPRLPRGQRSTSPKIRYHTLSISAELSRTQNIAEGAGASGSATAKHLCRGSFAHYTEENKLFGKYVGMFWRPMHIRGNAKHGIVGKEYAMEATDA